MAVRTPSQAVRGRCFSRCSYPTPTRALLRSLQGRHDSSMGERGNGGVKPTLASSLPEHASHRARLTQRCQQARGRVDSSLSRSKDASSDSSSASWAGGRTAAQRCTFCSAWHAAGVCSHCEWSATAGGAICSVDQSSETQTKMVPTCLHPSSSCMAQDYISRKVAVRAVRQCRGRARGARIVQQAERIQRGGASRRALQARAAHASGGV